jgi:hypothetical protein
MSGRVAILALITALLAGGCGKNRPEMPDGAGIISVTVTDTSGVFGGTAGEPFPVDSASVSIQGRTTAYDAMGMTDESGMISFSELPTGGYSVFVRREVKVGLGKKVLTGFGDIRVAGEGAFRKNITVKSILVSDLMISEVFFAGSCSSSFYFYDQYVEVYNAAADTLYLDNIIVTRQAQVKDPELETRSYVRALYAFQLHGTGRQYPIAPGHYAVIAADAVDHRLFGCKDLSYNLSLSNPNLSHLPGEPYKLYETFNALGNDYDVPGVPNFESIMPGRTTDFLINLSHNAIVIAEGGVYPIDADNYMQIPIEKVIDGVEYASNPYATTKEMTMRVDAGFAGVGVVKYSAQSTERREQGLDTNNSDYDFVWIERGTPGYFHAIQGQVPSR